MGGYGKSSMYKYQAGVAKMNSDIAKQNASWALDTGEKEGVRYGIKAGQREGTIVANQGASGFTLDSGSFSDVRDSQKMITRMDTKQIADNAARRAYGYEVTAANELAKSKMYKGAANQSVIEGWLGAGGSFLGGASSVSSKWLQGNAAGVWGSNGGSSWDMDPLGTFD
jgi:hypothetical protein